MATGIGSPLALGGLYPSVDGRYVAANGKPFTSVSNAESALNGFPSKLSESCVGLTVLVADENDPDYPKAKEYWVQPKGTTPETYGLVEKGAGTTDYADLDNKPTISDGGQGSAQIPLSGNVKVTAKAATSGQTTGVAVTAGQNGEINIDFTLEKGTDGINGKSAYQQWLDEGNTGDETDFLNSLKAHVAGFQSVAYDSNAPTTIGGTASAIGSLSPSADTMDKIVLMPNSDGTATIMYATTATESEGTTTYAFSCIGELAIDTSDFLNTSSVDTTNLKNPTMLQVAKASDVMGLKAKLEGVTATETKVPIYESGDNQNVVTGQYINGNTGVITTPSSNVSSYAYCSIPLNNAKAVRFLTGTIPSNSYSPGYAFGFFDEDNNNAWVSLSASKFDVGSVVKEKVISVPNGATHLLTTVKNYQGTIDISSFYCYLQSGESVIEMINVLDKNINGEDYEVVGDNIKQSYRNTQWKICKPSATGEDDALLYSTANVGFILDITPYIGKKLRVKANASNDSYYMVLQNTISTADAPYTVQQLIDGGYLCEEIHYVNSEWKPSRSISGNGIVDISIPNDAKRIIFAGVVINDNASRDVQSIKVISTEHEDGTLDIVKKELQQQIDDNKEDIEELQGVGEQVDGLVDDLYGVPTEITETPLMYIRKGSLDQTVFYGNPSIQTIYEIDISDATKVNISAQADSYFILFVSKAKLPTSGNLVVSALRSNYMAVCGGFAPESTTYRIYVSSGNDIELTLNENCKYLYISKYYSKKDRTPSSITATKTKRIGGIIEQISGEESNQGNALRLVIKDGKCFTAPIPCEKGFYLLVKDDYRITNAYLIDHLTGNIVNDDFSNYTTISSTLNKAHRRRSNMCKMPGFDIIYQIEKLDSSKIESSSGVIEAFSLVEDLYTRKLPTGVEPSIYRAWRDKVQTSIGNVWIPSLQAANKIPQSHGNNNPKRFGKGTTYIGINYSGPTQWGKHVGMQVSMRTFKTAVANPRSVMYTEIIGTYKTKTAQSKYGYTHNSYGKEAGAFYGCVCTGLTSYLMGFPIVFQSSEWTGNGSVAAKMDVIMQGTTSNPDVISCNGNEYSYDSKEDCKALAELLQPMDFIWKDEHCAAISDIYVDEWGEVKYIVISEQTTPISTSSAYTPEYFFLRFKNNIAENDNWKILRRKSAWTIEDVSIPRTSQDKEFVVMNNGQYNPEDMAAIDPDITTFAGEYAVFVIGDYSDTTNNYKMFLNIHRGGEGGYTHIQIFNEDDDETTATPVGEIDITSYQTDTSLGTNGYILPSDEDEDWIIYNLAEYWRTSQTNNTGKFKARVVRKESGSIVEDYVSGCTHFMMVAMSLNLNNSTINYIVKGAIPVVYECESDLGLFTGNSRYKNLVLDTDYTYDSETGAYTSVGTSLGGWTGAYLRLFASTDYGMANVRVAISNS